MNHKEQVIQFWDQFFKEGEPTALNPKEMKIENPLDQYLKELGDTCEDVLDVGCGTGYCLFKAHALGEKMKNGVGFDASKHAIDFANQTVQMSHLLGLSFHVRDESFLKTIPSESFDGMICSNFLDVIPKALSDFIIKEMMRILKPDGYLLLKLNFYLDENLIKKLNMTLIDENTYEMNDVIRAYNLDTNDWIKRFPLCEVLATDGYQRASNLPEDRIILFKKKHA
ncbi:MAG: class I SAM-dependent methyltransferase [Candidatus Izemoplasmataceae bacterium]